MRDTLIPFLIATAGGGGVETMNQTVPETGVKILGLDLSYWIQGAIAIFTVIKVHQKTRKEK